MKALTITLFGLLACLTLGWPAAGSAQTGPWLKGLTSAPATNEAEVGFFAIYQPRSKRVLYLLVSPSTLTNYRNCERIQVYSATTRALLECLINDQVPGERRVAPEASRQTLYDANGQPVLIFMDPQDKDLKKTCQDTLAFHSGWTCKAGMP